MATKSKSSNTTKTPAKSSRAQVEESPQRVAIDWQGRDVSSRPNKSGIREVVTRLREYVDLLGRVGGGDYAKGKTWEIRQYVHRLRPYEVAVLDVGHTITREKTKAEKPGPIMNGLESETRDLMMDCLRCLDDIGNVPVQDSIKDLRGKADELERIWDLAAGGPGERAGSAETSLGKSWQVPWDENAIEYIQSGEARSIFTEGKLSAAKLSNAVGTIPVHYMRKPGKGLRVHTAEFRVWAEHKYPTERERAEIAQEWLADIEARKAAERAKRGAKSR